MATPVEPVTACDAAAVTKSDTTVFTRIPTALYIGGTGDVTVRTAKGTTVTFSAVPVGAVLPIRVDQVLAATTATLILALFY